MIIVAGLYSWLCLQRPVVLRSAGWWTAQLLIGAVIIFPQLLYWHFAFGSWVAYSYGDEGFDNWRSPELSKFLFAPENGWTSHAPVLLLLPFGVWAMWREQRRLVIVLIGMLATAVYACASWHVWHFGCSYGARPMVEYMPFVALVVYAFFARTDPASVRLRWAILPLLTILVYLNHRAAMQFDICYEDAGNWNWDPYLRNLLDAFSGGYWEHHP